MKTVNWGVISTAKIGTEKVIPAIQSALSCHVKAICSRDIQAAQKVAAKLKIENAYGNYKEMLTDPAIDAVYIPLPNHLHVEWAIKALEHGKHVLVEKPLGLNSEEAVVLLEVSERFPHLKVMEGFMYRHHPQWLYALELVRDKQIGELKTINTFFSYYNDDPDNVRNLANIGGGALMDIGCYPISLSRFLFDAEPRKVIATLERDPQFKTDRLTSAILEFEQGTSTFTCSTQLSPYQRVLIYGSKGYIEIEIPFNAPPNKECRIWLTRDGVREEILFDICDQYTFQAELFARAIYDDKEVPTPLTDGIANMVVIDALFESGESGKWVELT
ncbi:Gfo/Idh/MocA family protein [Desulfopila sp. IMCC35008]|uniref:Gfo/Idh/MocA family protein n=1 Tax=Desulfopila sp. IMCC35008 TaxID=2653858 RepID=UPI0013D8CC8E|nr:Gfo/Idh/MocA family oxidoreductase [Desulfopila sp. IMCC35008]